MTSSRSVHWVLLALLLLGAGGCAGTLSGTAAGSVEKLTVSRVPQGPAVQVAPTVVWRQPRGRWLTAVGYAPTVLVPAGAAPLVRHRATASVAPGRTAGLGPYGRVSMDYGTVRPADLDPEEGQSPQPYPGGGVLTSYSVRSEGGLTGRLSRRTQLTLSAGLDRSAGLGLSAATLPELTLARLGIRGQHQRTRSQVLGGEVRASRYTQGEPALLVEADVRATVIVREGLSLTATLGGATAQAPVGSGKGSGGSKPLAGLAAAYSGPGPGGFNLGISLATRPAFDRLDGTLRQRLLGRASLGTRLFRSTRVTTSVNWYRDVSGIGTLRRILTADAALTASLSRDWSAVLGVRAFLQGTSADAGARTPSESRVILGLSRGWSLR